MSTRPKEFASDAYQVANLRRALTDSTLGDLVFRDNFYPQGIRLRDLATTITDFSQLISLISQISGGMSVLQQEFSDLYTQVTVISGSLQSQIDNLDSIYATDASLRTISGYLQSEIVYNTENISNIYNIIETISGYSATTSDLARISGYLQGEINYIINNYTTLADTARISAYLDNRITNFDVHSQIEGITSYLQSQINQLISISGNHEARIVNLETNYTPRSETAAVSGYLNDRIDVLQTQYNIFSSDLVGVSAYLYTEINDLRSDVVQTSAFLQSEIEDLYSQISPISASVFAKTFHDGSFVFANLSGGKLYVQHDLDTDTPYVIVYNNLKNQIIPDEVEVVDSNNIVIHLVSYKAIVGTWSYSVRKPKSGGSIINQTNIISGSIDLLSVNSDIIPRYANTYSLGTSGKPWKDGYFAGSSVYLGTKPISVVGDELSFNGNRVWTASQGVIGDITRSEVSQLTGYLNSRINQLAVISGAHEIRITSLENTYITRTETSQVSAYLNSRISAVSGTIYHNDLLGIQGGIPGEYYHLSASQFTDYVGRSQVAQISGFIQSEIIAISAYLNGRIITNHSLLTDLSATNAHPASSISLNTSNFHNNLSSSDTDVQKALETLDSISISGTEGHLILGENTQLPQRLKLKFTGNVVVSDDAGNDSTVVTISSSSDIAHNSTTGIQGGTTNEYYHLTNSQISGLISRTEVAAISSSISEGIITSHSMLTNLSADNVHPASSISVITTNFNRNLATTDDTLQKTLNKLDSLNLSGGLDLTLLTTSIIPTTSGTLDLGSLSKPFRDLYVTTASIHMGTKNISISGNMLTLNGDPIPSQSKAMRPPSPPFGLGTYARTVDLSANNSNSKAFYGGLTDGRYAYFLPAISSGTATNLVRLDSNDFSSISVLNLYSTDSTFLGFQGGFSDGRYLYMVPGLNSKVARVDLANFSTVSIKDLGTTDSQLKGFHGGFTDGTYGYFVPNQFTKVGRLDLTNFSSVSVLSLSGDPALTDFRGGFTDGTYAYFVPGTHSKFTRVKISDFSTIETLDLSTVSASLKGFWGGFIAGKHGYLVPHYNDGVAHGNVVKVDLTNFSTVSYIDLTQTDAALKGFRGGFTDGIYAYFVPYDGGKVARLDLYDFSTVSVVDLTITDPSLTGFVGGFADTKYGYFVPYYNTNYFGKVARLFIKYGGGF